DQVLDGFGRTLQRAAAVYLRARQGSEGEYERPREGIAGDVRGGNGDLIFRVHLEMREVETGRGVDGHIPSFSVGGV
ncbi:hypothetical protein PFISCL1PPCAC_23154, partial [Pristionchus fissidentatus]